MHARVNGDEDDEDGVHTLDGIDRDGIDDDDDNEHADTTTGPSTLHLPLTRENIYAWLEEAGLTAAEKLARRLAYVFHVGVVACAADEHARWQAVHEARCAHHAGLAHTWSTQPTGYNVASTTELPHWKDQLGLRCPLRPLGGKAMQLTRHDLPTASRLEAVYSGWPDTGRHAATEICLHTDDRPAQTLQAAVHDVDSFIHVTRDPTDFAGPLHVCLAPQPASLLTKSIHITLPVPVDDKTVHVRLHRVPHLVFARRGQDVLYMFFPRLYRRTRAKAAVFLTNKQYSDFFEGLVHPCFARIGQAFTHHVPGSFLSVQASSRAATEATGATNGRSSNVDVPFHDANLRQLWDAMRTVLDRADQAEELGGVRVLRQFGDPVFVYNAKNTKLQYQTWQQTAGSTASAAIDAFWASASTIVATSRRRRAAGPKTAEPRSSTWRPSSCPTEKGIRRWRGGVASTTRSCSYKGKHARRCSTR